MDWMFRSHPISLLSVMSFASLALFDHSIQKTCISPNLILKYPEKSTQRRQRYSQSSSSGDEARLESATDGVCEPSLCARVVRMGEGDGFLDGSLKTSVTMWSNSCSGRTNSSLCLKLKSRSPPSSSSSSSSSSSASSS